MRGWTGVAGVAAGALGAAVILTPLPADGAAFSGNFGRTRVNFAQRRISGFYATGVIGPNIYIQGLQYRVNVRRRSASFSYAAFTAELPSRLEELQRQQFPVVVESGIEGGFSRGSTTDIDDVENVAGYAVADGPFKMTITRYTRLRPGRDGDARCRIAGTLTGTMTKEEDSTATGPAQIAVRVRFNAVLNLEDQF